MPPSKYTRGFAKVFGIDLNQDRRLQEFEEPLRQAGLDAYFERDPTVGEYFRSLTPTKHGAVTYIHDLFPSAQWITRYNWRWLVGDAIAGLTVGFVVVPQAMAYALLAQLSPEYGLYTSFAGAAMYWVFGTSKDIVIGVSSSLHMTLTILTQSDYRCGIASGWLGHHKGRRSPSWCVYSTRNRKGPLFRHWYDCAPRWSPSSRLAD